MIIRSDGRIAYHALLLREDGGTDFVQYDFDGSVLYKYHRTGPSLSLLDCKYN